MAKQSLGIGSSANDGTGDTLRAAADKVNDNFAEIYTLIGDESSLTTGISATASVVTLTSPTITTSIVPTTADGASLGTSSAEFSDLFLADAAVINLGSDQDVTLTHVADTGVLLNSTNQLQFGDSGTYIHQSADGVLDLVSDTEIEINATTIDVNGNLDVSGTIVGAGALTAATSITVGSAVLTEAELETLDGITAGTVIASKAIITDSDKDITGGRNITISGELDAATGDFSGDVDVDGTLEADAITIGGVTLAETISDTVGAMVGSNTETGITVSYEDGDNTLDFVLGTTQTTITSLTNASLVIGRDADNDIDFATDNTILFRAEGADQIKLVNGALVPVADNDIDLGTASLEFKDAFFDGTVTSDAFAGPLTGNVTGTADVATVATTVTITDNESTDEDNAIIFTAGGDVDGGNLGLESDGTLTYNPSTGTVTATGFAGALTGNVTGNASGTAATVTGAAQTNITSVGTLTALQVDNININTNTISTTAGTDLLITPLAGQQIVLDGTIVIDAGVVTGATSITSTAFVGDITGDVTGTADVATVATTVTITDNESTNENNAIIFTAGGDVDGGNIGLESDGTLTYNPSTGKITATGFVGTLTGDVTGDVTGTSSIATTVTVADESSDTTCFPLFSTAATGNLGAKSGSNLTFNSSSGLLTATSLAGTVTTATQNSITTATGLVSVGALDSGSITSNFGTINTGASAITTTGLISGGSLDIDDVLINGTTIGHTDDTDLITLTDGVVTVAGELDAVTGDFSGAVDIAGDLTLSAGTDGALTFGAASSVKIVDNSATSLVIEEANTAYMTFDTANSGGEQVTMGKKLDMNGLELILDADADTSITSDTDDQIDIRIAGADDFTFTANTFTAVSGSTIAAQALTATTITATSLAGRKVITTNFNTNSAVTASLTAAQSGATVLIDGTDNNVINLPAAATTNPGLVYDFIVLTAVASDKTTIVNIAGSGGNFVGALSLAGGTAANAVLDNAGDAFTFVNSTVVGSRARITCLTDDGTDGVWQVESLASPIATID